MKMQQENLISGLIIGSTIFYMTYVSVDLISMHVHTFAFCPSVLNSALNGRSAVSNLLLLSTDVYRTTLV